MKTQRHHLHQFSLVELLTVIVIILILASLLLPALDRVHERAITTQCKTQLRQLGTALANYIGENQFEIPKCNDSGTRFQERLMPYLSDETDIWFCEGARVVGYDATDVDVTNDKTFYGMNHYKYLDGQANGGNYLRFDGTNAAQIADHAGVIALSDAQYNQSPCDIGGNESNDPPESDAAWPLTSLAEMRHMLGYNAAFLDQHVEFRLGDSFHRNHREWAARKDGAPPDQ